MDELQRARKELFWSLVHLAQARQGKRLSVAQAARVIQRVIQAKERVRPPDPEPPAARQRSLL